MPYNLPHAVLALLQQEGSQPQPKAYFVRSSSKSTKITLVYPKRRRKGESCGGFNLSETPNLSQDPLESTQLYGACSSRNSVTTLVSSSPLYSKQILPENFTFPSRSVCPTETSTTTTLREGRSRSMSVRGRDGYEFNTTPDDDDDDDDDDDLSDHYIALSPSLYGDDKPLTPGRDFEPSESPRPPTPNQQNYNFLVGSGSKGHSVSPSRQPTIEYDDGEFHPAIPNSFQPKSLNVEKRDGFDSHGQSSRLEHNSDTDSLSSHSRMQKQSGGGSTVITGSTTSNSSNRNGSSNHNQQPSKRSSRPTPPVMVQRSSPDHKRHHQHHQRSHSDRRYDADHAMTSSGNRHSYQRVASWDGPRP